MSNTALRAPNTPDQHLICTAAEIFDSGAFDLLMTTNPDRAAVVSHLKAAQKAGRDRIAAAFRAAPFAARPATQAYA